MSEIRAFLDGHVAAWNRVDLASFVDGYSNDASYIGADRLTRGRAGADLAVGEADPIRCDVERARWTTNATMPPSRNHGCATASLIPAAT
jgi:hypothetical protein